jgi:hypothetical protein
MILPPGSRNCKFACRLRIGRFSWDFRRSRSAGAVSSDMHRLSGRFGLPSLHSKIPLPAAAVAVASRRPVPFSPRGNIGSFGRPKARRFEAGLSRFNPGASKCWLPERQEVARNRSRVANDLRPPPARGLVRGTRARSSLFLTCCDLLDVDGTQALNRLIGDRREWHRHPCGRSARQQISASWSSPWFDSTVRQNWPHMRFARRAKTHS